jgi:hypothetical protein
MEVERKPDHARLDNGEQELGSWRELCHLVLLNMRKLQVPGTIASGDENLKEAQQSCEETIRVKRRIRITTVHMQRQQMCMILMSVST